MVDTSVWSFVLRRRTEALSPREKRIADELANLIDEGRARLIGPIRQEILSGIREPSQYSRLREDLAAFEDEPVPSADFEFAAELSNQCRAAGIAGSTVDFLICGAAVRRNWSIFTADRDFQAYAKLLRLKLHSVRDGSSG